MFNLMKSKPEIDNELDPPPCEIDMFTGKMMWEFDHIKVWADNYQQALEMLQIIDKF